MNVVFIVLDTVRKDRISVYNEDINFTENLEKFSENATIFENAVSQAPWTLPSHSSMFTGLYPWEHKATQKNLYLETEKTLLAEKFKQENYQTACFTSNTWISPYIGTTDGFDEVNNFFGALPNNLMSGKTRKLWQWLNQGKSKVIMEKIMDLGEKLHWMGSEPSTKTPETIDKAKQFINNTEGEFFLFLNFMDAHLPYRPPEEYKEKHAENVDMENVCQKAFDHNAGRVQADFEASKKLYNAEIDYLDDQLGRLFEYFEKEDLMEETIFLIVSDHGENLGEDNMFGHQFSVSENLINVPLIVKKPGKDPEKISDIFELKQIYNYLPSLAEIEEHNLKTTEYAKGGYEYPELDLRNIPEEKKKELGKRLRFVKDKNKKLVREGEKNPKDIMYDLETGEKIEVEEKYVEKLEDKQVESKGKKDVEEEEVKERLEELGYM
ncbi:MAG: sulfatase [Candidatus Nanohaloarchaea archaeon]